MTYELIREIFNECSRNQMRDVFVSEVETEDLDSYVKQFLIGSNIKCNKSHAENGVVIFDIDTDDLKQRLSFTPC
ncbi:hypothetical protein FACS189494_03300 [Spirochaetia bacterium]|nr:hypothetical protein FACS189494_03300 [Spirochaetia bacterium]